MVGHGGSSAGSYLADPTSPIPSHCASIVVASTLRVSFKQLCLLNTSLMRRFSCSLLKARKLIGRIPVKYQLTGIKVSFNLPILNFPNIVKVFVCQKLFSNLEPHKH